MESMTRAQYEQRLQDGLGMPLSFDLIEPDGTTKVVINSFGSAAAVKNTRLKDRTVRDSLTLLADLVEYHGFGRSKGQRDSVLSDFIDGGSAYKEENDSELETIVSPLLKQLQTWIDTPASQKKGNADARQAAIQTVQVLRSAGFQ